MNNKQCAICLESTNHKVYKYCKDCNIYIHKKCFYYYINYKNILPECIICKKKCQLNTNQSRVHKIKNILSIIYFICKNNILDTIKLINIIILWYNYLSVYVFNSFKEFILYIINEIYNTNGYYLMLTTVYGLAKYYTNTTSCLFIYFMFKMLLYNTLKENLLDITIIKSIYEYKLYKNILPNLLISIIITILPVINIYRFYNVYKKWNLINNCYQYN